MIGSTMKKHVLIILLILSSLCSCQEEDDQNYTKPICHTGDINNISESGATFKAYISNLGDDQIIDHGFLWSVDGININVSRVSLGARDKDGQFETDVDFDLMKDTSYFVSSYLKTKTNWIVSNPQLFNSKGSLAPILTQIIPENADANDTISLIGNRFSYVPEHLHVFLENKELEIISSTPSEIKVILPRYLGTSGYSTLKVKSQNEGSSEKINLRIKGPLVSKIFPNSGFPNSIIEISGEDFGPQLKYGNSVKLGDYDCQIIEWTDKLITVRTTISYEGIFNISVITPYKTTTQHNCFEVVYPKFIDFSPKSVMPGDTIYVELDNPDENINNYRASFGDYYAYAPIKIQGNKLLFLTPNKISPGLKTFSIEYKYNRHKFASQINIESHFVPLAELPSDKLQNPFLFTLNGNIYIGGGNNENNNISVLTKEVWMYRTSNNTWERKADFPGNARIMTGYFSINNKGYIVGGRENSRYNNENSAEVWEYEPNTDTWTQKSNYPEGGVIRPQCQVIDGKVYIGYGRRNNQLLKRFHEYNPENDTWKELPLPKLNRGYYSSLTHKGKFYLFWRYTDQIQIYTPSENSWSSLKIDEIGNFKNMNASITIEDDIYILGDIDYSWKLVKINPETKKWSELLINTLHPFSNKDISISMNNQIYYFNSNNSYNDPKYHLFRLDLPLK